MNKKIPTILLIGAGRFGTNHLRVLQTLEKDSVVKLQGVVVNTKRSAKKIARNFGCQVQTDLGNSLLQKVDAVDIVTPASTHFPLVKKCLKYTNVFVEKPLALGTLDAQKLIKLAKSNKKILVVGHIFRFNPAVLKLKDLVGKNYQKLYFIEGKFTGQSLPNDDCGAIFTYLHHFDILDFILGEEPLSVYAQTANPVRKNGRFEDEAKIILTYDQQIAAFLHLGWVGLRKNRTINLFFDDMEVYCDLKIPQIKICRPGSKSETLQFAAEEPLENELRHFINSICKKNKPYPDGNIGLRAVKVAEKALISASTNKIIYF